MDLNDFFSSTVNSLATSTNKLDKKLHSSNSNLKDTFIFFAMLANILIVLPIFQRLFIISSLILFIESVTYFVACSS